jgi:hypothetical protein
MITFRDFGLVLIFSALLGSSTSSLASEIVCPETINVEQRYEGVPEGSWVALDTYFSNVHHFDAISFSNGPPTDRAFLSPDQSVTKKYKKNDVYIFPSGMKSQVWVLCQYLDTSVSIARPLTEVHHRCEVTYDSLTAFASVKSVNCH